MTDRLHSVLAWLSLHAAWLWGAIGVGALAVFGRKGAAMAQGKGGPGPGWTFGTGARVKMRLHLDGPTDVRAELARLGFSDVALNLAAPDGPTAEGIAGGGFVPKGLILDAEPETLFPAVLPDVNAVPVVGEVVTQPTVSRTVAMPWEFYENLVTLCNAHGWDPLGALSIMWSESSLNPAAGGGPGHPAVGLIQFDGSLPNVGYTGTPAQFAQLSAVQQLPYVERYYVQDKLPAGATATAFYLCNYEPAKLAHWNDPSFVLDTPTDGTGFYKANGPVFDVNPTTGTGYPYKGTITVGDLTARLARVCVGPTWAEHVARLNWAIANAGGGGAAAASSVAPVLAGVALVMLAAFGTWAYVQVQPEWLPRPPRALSRLVARMA